MRDAGEIVVSVGGEDYADVVSMRVTKGLEQLVDSATVAASNRWLHEGKLALPFRAGDECSISLDGEKLVTGYIRSIPRGYSENTDTISIEVVSKAYDVTTSSYVGKRRKWTDATLDQIVRDVLDQYGFDLTVPVGLDLGDKFRKFGAGAGECSWSVIQRALKKRGLWMVSEPDGSVALTESGARRYLTPIVGPGQGVVTNVIAAETEDIYGDRHDEVIVVGNSASAAKWTGDQAARGVARAYDPGVPRRRPLVVMESSESNQAGLKKRADYEVRTRAGRSRPIAYTLLAWAEHDPGEPLWEPNRIVRVQDPKLDIAGEFLITGTETVFERGSTARLTLVAPETYEIDAPMPDSRTDQPRTPDGRYSPWA